MPWSGYGHNSHGSGKRREIGFHRSVTRPFALSAVLRENLAQIYNSFANYNYIIALIKYKCLLFYLEGQYFNKVLFKWKMKH